MLTIRLKKQKISSLKFTFTSPERGKYFQYLQTIYKFILQLVRKNILSMVRRQTLISLIVSFYQYLAFP